MCAGQSNGYIKGYLNGAELASKSGIKFVETAAQHIDTLMFDNFFGGSAGDAAAKDEVRD